MAQQTAVEWLIEQLVELDKELDGRRKSDDSTVIKINPTKIYKQAKQMEKEQIIKAHGDKGWAKPIIDDNGIPKKDGIAFGTTTGEQYYKETYNNTPS